MAKRVFSLVLASSIITALLLFIGTAIVGRFSPVFASSTLPGLIAGGQALLLGDNAKAETGVSSTPDATETAEVSSTPDDRRSSEPSSTPGASDDNSQGTPVTGVSIAQLLANSGQYMDGVFTISGMASVLSGDKLLLNDGTGQILVDLEDDLIQYMAQNGATITVTGEFRRERERDQFALKACVVADQNGTFVLDTCEFRHGSDDSSDDDSNHNNGDDSSDDDSNSGSGGSDDKSGSGSNSGSGSSDDNSGSGSNSGSGGSEDRSGSGKNRP
ncbi:MAG: hypothetical protein HY835_12365 [Anaerolineae bacterium]|nr:hypothetical protein [Anaerolineae bacterium]